MRHSRFILACAAACLAAQAAQAAVVLSVQPQDQTVMVGDTFNIEIHASMTLPITGWGFDCEIVDPTIVSFNGPPTIDGGWWAAFAPDGDDLAALAFPNPISGGDVLLATYELTADQVGETDIHLSITAGDLTEGFALVTPGAFDDVVFEDGHVTVIAAPAPAAFVALAGFPLLAHRRRRRI